ncbi:MAG: ATP-binding protein [Candidatus Micrarchaeia archaeon]
MSLPREEEQQLLPKIGWKEALALIGPRRAGKSTLALRLLDAWHELGGEGKYVDLESFGAPSKVRDLVKEISTVPKGGLVVLDEAQALVGWVKAVRDEIENGRRHVIVTGSSASLLSAEISSALAGRAIPQPILPLSFRDALSWGLRSFDEYLKVGGYPEAVLRPSDAQSLHKVYFELAVLRDVAARQGIRETKALYDLGRLLLSEPGKAISSARTSAALGISQPTYRSFVQGLNDAFLILSVPPFFRSPRQKLVADAKHYAYDTGMQKSVSISESDDRGRRVENAVALELVRAGYSLSFLSGAKSECDFIAQKTGEKNLAVQVCSGEDVPEREIPGLEFGMKTAGASGLLLCESEAKVAGIPKGAECRTVQDWLMETRQQ